MLYPEFLKENGTIGICAPSAGVGRKLDEFKESNRFLKSLGYHIKETASVRVNNPRSTTARKRARELEELFLEKKVDFIMCAAGGDFMLEMMEYVDFDVIKNNPKWISGMSDPTNILFPITTSLDIATMYGRNGAGFTFEGNRSQSDFLGFVKGKIVKQNSYRKYRTFLDEIEGNEIYKDVRWVCKKDQTIEGRLIGGCIESIDKLIGTKFDHTNEFIDRYKDDGIVWYFDIFDMSSYNFYLTLLQFKNAGWFRYCKGVLISRPAFPNVEDKKLDYIRAADKALGKIAHILEMDIGHTSPNMTLINGAMVKAEYKDGKGSISFKLK